MSVDLDKHIEMALQRLSEAEVRVDLQEGVIERLMAAGHDAYVAQETLDVLRESVRLLRANYRAALIGHQRNAGRGRFDFRAKSGAGRLAAPIRKITRTLERPR